MKHSPGIKIWLKLVNAEGIGPKTLLKLLDRFNSPENIMGASVKELTRVNGIGFKTAEKIAKTRDDFDSDKELETAEKHGVKIINLPDPGYPTLLKKIYDPPPVLYIKGDICKSDNLSIAIVGSRRCSIYGREQASKFAHLLSSAGFTVVSGMARGIDTYAHQGALSGQGRTIAVQGCGLANIFPRENEKIYEHISQNGAVVSELPMEAEPLAENFPPRNRIIAGLSLGTIIIEAGLRSGSLITARMAMENNREVMAVPGKIDSPLSSGSNKLIKDGAMLVDSIEDIVKALGYIGEKIKDHVTQTSTAVAEELERPKIDAGELSLSKDERIIYDCLSKDPLHLENLIEEVDIAPGAVNASLISLQLKGLVNQLPGNMFQRK